LADQLDDHTLVNKNAPLNQQFKNIGTMVHQQLHLIVDQRQTHTDDDSDESLNVKELINDFATDEFVHKNVRVRPTSSYSLAGKDQSEMGARGGNGQPPVTEDEEDRKFNTETIYDLTQQRNEKKDRKKKEEQDRLLEAEKAEKKKRAKQ